MPLQQAVDKGKTYDKCRQGNKKSMNLINQPQQPKNLNRKSTN